MTNETGATPDSFAGRVLGACRRALGVEADESDPAHVKRAYRDALRRHPPDRDAEGFRRVRAAYETLSDPRQALERALLSESPLVDPPLAPEAPKALPGTAALALLRAVVARLPAEELLAEPHDGGSPNRK
jgi:curved DNA-binding protein CbpA